MSARLGLGVGRDSVRAVLVRRGGVAWSTSTRVGEGETLREALDRVLSAVPRSRLRRRPRAFAAVGPATSQVKRLTGLPPAKDDRVLGQAIAGNVGQFFLRNGVPLRVTGIAPARTGGVWAGAIEAPVVAAIEEACNARRIPFDGAAPAVAILGRSLSGTAEAMTVVWRDGDVTAEAKFARRVLIETRRTVPEGDGAEVHPPLHAALTRLNGSGWRFADAFAAANAERRGPLVVRPLADARRRKRIAMVGRGVLLALLALVGVGALVAPGIIAAHARATATARLTRLAPRQREVAVAQRALLELTVALQQSSDFVTQRRSMTRLLAALTEALPESTAIVTMRVDSAGGSFTALAPRGAAVLTALKQVSTIGAARITGPITRERVEGVEVERVGIRFQFPSRAPVAAPTSAEKGRGAR